MINKLGYFRGKGRLILLLAILLIVNSSEVKIINRIPLYVLNNFIRFERKLYQVFGLELGRPLRLKAVMYFFAIVIVEATLYFTPGIGRLINWIPVGILILIPIGLAWLLADVGTEGRSPVYFFRSFIFYQARKLKGGSLYRGRQVDKEKDYQFHNYYTYRSPLLINSDPADVYSEIEKEHERVMAYLACMANREEMEVADEMLPELDETQRDKSMQKQLNQNGQGSGKHED